ncbi:MAG: amidohydrolase family protein [Bacteriovoracia bacterium]
MNQSRRWWMTGLAIGATVLGAYSFFSRPVVGAEGASGISPGIIDAHIHTDFDGKPDAASGIVNSAEQLFKEMDKHGVVGAVSMTGQDHRRGFDASLKRKQVKFCAGVAMKVDVAGIERGLKAGDYSCIKIYLGYVYRYAYDAAYRPLYRLARKYKVPVVFHTGDTYSVKGKLKYADPLTVDEVAVDFPDVNFVIAHCGNPWIQSAAEVAYKNPNVYLDGSALLIGDLSKSPKDKVDAYVVQPLAWVFGYLENPSKLMYGTDWALTDMGSYIEAFKRAIPKEHWQAVFHDNAAKVFGFSPPPTAK